MAQVFAMPQLGSTMEEGTILKWRRAEGEAIRKGETLLEIETDKATMEVEAPEDAVVRKLLFPEASVVSVQKPIAILGDALESITDLIAALGMEGAATPPVAAAPAHKTVKTGPGSAAPAGGAVSISPRARRAADERGISIATLTGRGTGPGGRIVERDVQAAADEPAAVTGRAPRRPTPLAARVAEDLGIDLGDLAHGLPGSRVRVDDVLRHKDAPRDKANGGSEQEGYRSVPFAGMRRRIADNVSRSRATAPHVTLTIEVDMTECVALRAKILDDIEKVYGARLSFTDFLVKTSARALQDHPALNSALVNDEIRVYHNQNIGVAVALDEGLVVPVIRNAAFKALGAISAEMKPLIERARTGKFTPEDLAGGTFTITNLGAFGIDMFDPIIVPPQAAILGVCRIAEKPVVIAQQVAIRSMMNLCLSFDHRIVDGAPAARFLQHLKQLLENPLSAMV